jgi:hypothetical protein
MKTWNKSTLAGVAVTLAATLLTAQQASAGCPGQTSVSPGLTPAVYLEGAAGGRLIRTDYDERPVITGLWSFTFTAKGNSPPGPPDGTPIDSGYVTWHADGTELMNSGREPLTGSFCMGVWKRVGESTFRLNHVALSWDSTGTVLVGPANIRETVTVDDSGNHYSGTFSLYQFASDGKTVLAHVVGIVSGTRITVN